MGNPIDAASISSDDDNRQHPTSTQAAEDSATALQELHIDDTSTDIGGHRSFPGEGRTFTVDPNVFTQWNAGKPAIINDEGTPSVHPVSPSVTGQTNGTDVDSTKQPAPNDNALALGASAEVNVESAKKKSKNKNKKSKSKRGLVQTFQAPKTQRRDDNKSLLGSTHRLRGILCGRTFDPR